MDLLCPIGKGQLRLLVAPPRTGKTMLLQDIAHAVSINHPEIHLVVLLIDERPEEVTEMRRLVKGEVISSSLDNDVESHIRLATLIIERAKRLAEEGKDVFILLDSITRLARAFNKNSNTGRTGTGGLDICRTRHPQKALRTGSTLRRRWLSHRLRHGAHRYRQPHGRSHLPGIQGHRQHGDDAQSRPRRPPHLALHRHHSLRHPPRRKDSPR
ncbi:MAG UNVERIFIED_CONTAM: hypothetical protein LVR18_32340 [Planctomycetaceae bacterium]